MRRAIKGPIILPLVFIIVLLGLLAHSYIKALNISITEQYQQIEFQLKRTSNILAELDYTFSNAGMMTSSLMEKQSLVLRNGFCEVRPTRQSLAAEKHIFDSNVVAIDETYVVIGDESLCTVNSPLYQLVKSRIALAPVLRLSRSIDDFVYGVHYVDLAGVMISSPPAMAAAVGGPLIEKMQQPGWDISHELAPREVGIRGPMVIPHVNGGRPLLFMLMSVKSVNINGVIALDLDTGGLLDCHHTQQCHFKLIDSQDTPLPNDAYLPHTLAIENFNSHHQLYYQLHWSREMVTFLSRNQNVLVVIFCAYVVLMAVLFFIEQKKKQSYYKKLANYDPLTNLLNRRGFEAFWKSADHQEQLVVAMFDIDDFKQVNDRFGHDVGDLAIQYIAATLRSQTRDADAVARFGGEEFVLYMTGHDAQTLLHSLERVRQAICSGSTVVVEGGFTVSVGAVVTTPGELHSFNDVFKAADQKLYQAKESGKNRLVV